MKHHSSHLDYIDVLFAVDPASYVSGLAMFRLHDDNSVRLSLVKDIAADGDPLTMATRLFAEMLRRIEPIDNIALAIERPQAYTSKAARSHGVEKIKAVIDSLESLFMRDRTTLYFALTPNQWKGQLPKAIHHARLREALSAFGYEENFGPDAFDAFGLGCFVLGITDRRGLLCKAV